MSRRGEAVRDAATGWSHPGADGAAALPGSPSKAKPARRFGFVSDLWGAYLRKLDTAPVITKSLTCLVGSILGDLLAQSASPLPFDWHRTVKMGAFAFAWGGPSGHYWNLLLDRTVLPKRATSLQAVVTKMAFDQLLFCPLVTCLFFSYLKIVEGRPHEIAGFIADKLWPTLMANYMLWPAVVLIGFRFVPIDLRVIYGNAIGVLWGAYVSIIAHAPASGEPYPHAEVKVE